MATNQSMQDKSFWKINNLFSDTELKDIHETVSEKRKGFNSDFVFIGDSPLEDASLLGPDNNLGRLNLGRIGITDEVYDKLKLLVKEKTDKNLQLSGVSCFEYSNKYGAPNLPPHFDSCATDLIVNFQLDSNTNWDLGLDLNIYTLENNSAIIFNPNTIIHWRPIKSFKDEDFVTMIFFRYTDYKTDNSHLMLSQNDEAFRKIIDYRMNLQRN